MEIREIFVIDDEEAVMRWFEVTAEGYGLKCTYFDNPRPVVKELGRRLEHPKKLPEGYFCDMRFKNEKGTGRNSPFELYSFLKRKGISTEHFYFITAYKSEEDEERVKNAGLNDSRIVRKLSSERLEELIKKIALGVSEK